MPAFAAPNSKAATSAANPSTLIATRFLGPRSRAQPGELAKLHRVSRTTIARVLNKVCQKGSFHHHSNTMKIGGRKRLPNLYHKLWV